MRCFKQTSVCANFSGRVTLVSSTKQFKQFQQMRGEQLQRVVWIPVNDHVWLWDKTLGPCS